MVISPSHLASKEIEYSLSQSAFNDSYVNLDRRSNYVGV
jgi:hypothetical protein